MPRQRRVDFSGLLQHVIARGIERRPVFFGDEDYSDFLSRLEAAKEKSPCQILAWCLMPNHIHLLVRPGEDGLARFMRRLMSGYAVAFNVRHRRRGYVFQNRYKSFVCQEEPYLLELVRYIHLNPVRARLVETVSSLRNFPYSGHAVLMGARKAAWQETRGVLERFGADEAAARRKYEQFLKDRLPDALGGGETETIGCSSPVAGERLSARDPRIVGDGEFVHRVWEKLNRKDHVRRALRNGGNLETVAAGVAARFGVPVSSLYLRGRQDQISKAKAALIHIAVDFMGKSVADMARLTRMTPQAAGKASYRGRQVAGKLAEELKVT